MRTIYKYPLETVDTQIIEVPGIFGFGNSFNKQFLCIDVQYGVPCLWCIVDTDSKSKRKIKLRIVGTGNPMPEFLGNEDYLGSYQLLDGQFVGHVFVEDIIEE